MASTVNYDEEKGSCILFLSNFKDVYSGDSRRPKYVEMLQEISNRKRRTLDIALDDVETFFENTEHGVIEFCSRIEQNTLRYISLFAQSADGLVPAPNIDDIEADVFDVLADHRYAMGATGPEGPSNKASQVPPSLTRRFDVYLKPRTKADHSKLRSICATNIGKLVTLRGVVTHITDVKPLVTVVAYTDQESGHEVYQEVNGRTFMPIEGTEGYTKSKNPPVMETRGSKFTKFQECRIQELADEVPEGATPRTISVHLRGEICRSVKPGEDVILTGVFLPEPITGFAAMRAGLLTSTFLLAMDIQHTKLSYAQHKLTAADTEELARMGEEGNVYDRLAQSIAPEIFGHEDVKKAMMLLMVGGTTKHLSDGMKLRGDIHVCLMGDPGVAKSQLLKAVSRIAPRAVYTTGKGSSGVGLTAAVMRNKTTKELVLEGGALVLADKGICCIDEFDKMEESDRTAIHEVMEQQTVSIAKAGITTTLNTRTTLLTAANPAWGRYDKRRTPTENIALPAALLSRFDLLWLILDESNPENDKRLAEHILHVHRYGVAPTREGPAALSPEKLRTYIAMAKSYEPCITPDLTDYITAVYSEMRQLEKGQMETSSTYTTPRTLLSILRLAQSIAKMRFDSVVIQSDIDEALRLMKMSKSSLTSDSETKKAEDSISVCYRLIRDEARKHSLSDASGTVTYDRIVEITAKYGISREDILGCIQEYADIAVWTLEKDQNGNPNVICPNEDL